MSPQRLACAPQSSEIDKAVGHIDPDVTPELTSALAELRRAMVTTDQVLKNTDATLLGIAIVNLLT